MTLQTDKSETNRRTPLKVPDGNMFIIYLTSKLTVKYVIIRGHYRSECYYYSYLRFKQIYEFLKYSFAFVFQHYLKYILT